MYLTGLENTGIWTDSNRNFTLRQYGRMEYGSSEIGWLLASPKTPRAPQDQRLLREGRPMSTSASIAALVLWLLVTISAPLVIFWLFR